MLSDLVMVGAALSSNPELQDGLEFLRNASPSL
jgi:hypothetical protein